MVPGETRDLVFAGAGMLWCTVTLYRGIRQWRRQRAPVSALVAAVAVLVAGGAGYLAYRL